MYLYDTITETQSRTVFSVARCKNSDKQNVDNSRPKKNILVKESNVIARAQLNPPAESVWEERIIAQIVAFNTVDDTTFPETAFMLGQLFDTKKKISGAKFQQISKAVRKLGGTTYTIFKSRDKFTVYPIFAYIEYDHGIITGQINPQLKPYYLQLKRDFSLRSLPDFQRLSSIYSQQIYRFLASIRALKETEVSIERLYFVTTAPESLQKNFKDFRCRVLEPAEKEINEKTKMFFHWEPVKQGRKVVAIRFIFGNPPQGDDMATLPEAEEHKKWQRLSNACYEKHMKTGSTCKPNKGQKCTFCQTRGRMAFKDA